MPRNKRATRHGPCNPNGANSRGRCPQTRTLPVPPPALAPDAYEPGDPPERPLPDEFAPAFLGFASACGNLHGERWACLYSARAILGILQRHGYTLREAAAVIEEMLTSYLYDIDPLDRPIILLDAPELDVI